MTKRIALLAAVVLLVLTVALVAWQLRSVVSVFILAVAISAVLSAPTDALVRRGWRRSLAMLVTFGGTFVLLIGLLYMISIPTLEEIDPLAHDLLLQYQRIQGGVVEGQSAPLWATRLPTTERVGEWLAGGSDDATALRGLVGATEQIGNLVAQLALALVLAIYWAADRLRFERLWLSLFPPERRGRVRAGWNKFESEVGAYIRSEMIQSILAGGLFTLGFWMIGVKYPYVTALFAALLWLIPFVGFLLSAFVVMVVGGLTSIETALGALAYTVIILAVMEFYVERILYPRERNWGVLLVLVMLGMVELLGLVGLLVATPIAVAAQLLLNNWLERTPEPDANQSAKGLAEVKSRLAALRERVGGESSPRVNDLARRLETLIAEAETTAFNS